MKTSRAMGTLIIMLCLMLCAGEAWSQTTRSQVPTQKNVQVEKKGGILNWLFGAEKTEKSVRSELESQEVLRQPVEEEQHSMDAGANIVAPPSTIIIPSTVSMTVQVPPGYPSQVTFRNPADNQQMKCRYPQISKDGNFFAALCQHQIIIGNQPLLVWNVFVHDRDRNETIKISSLEDQYLQLVDKGQSLEASHVRYFLTNDWTRGISICQSVDYYAVAYMHPDSTSHKKINVGTYSASNGWQQTHSIDGGETPHYPFLTAHKTYVYDSAHDCGKLFYQAKGDSGRMGIFERVLLPDSPFHDEVIEVSAVDSNKLTSWEEGPVLARSPVFPGSGEITVGPFYSTSYGGGATLFRLSDSRNGRWWWVTGASCRPGIVPEGSTFSFSPGSGGDTPSCVYAPVCDSMGVASPECLDSVSSAILLPTSTFINKGEYGLGYVYEKYHPPGTGIKTRITVRIDAPGIGPDRNVCPEGGQLPAPNEREHAIFPSVDLAGKRIAYLNGEDILVYDLKEQKLYNVGSTPDYATNDINVRIDQTRKFGPQISGDGRSVVWIQGGYLYVSDVQ